MMKHGHIPPMTAGQLLTLAFVAYANYQVLKWVFLALKTVVTSDFLGAIIFKLTPASVIKRREVRRKLQIQQARIQKEKAHQDALENHRKYKSPFFNLQFISEDRGTLFKGFNIKWQEGNQKIGQTKKPWTVENQEIAFLMFREMGAVRLQLLKRQDKWTPEMERFWLKILPKRFVSKEKKMTDLEKAIVDFEDDIATKASA